MANPFCNDVTIDELIDQSLTKKPDFEIIHEITTPAEKEQFMSLYFGGEPSDES